jgi:Family of unknown function (DUF6152)
MEVSMKNLKIVVATTVAAGLLLLAVPLFAHHSFAAEFDANKCRDFTGILTKVDWQNPHGYFYLDIKDANGKVESWSFQTYALITLKRAGIDRQFFVDLVGKEVWVKGCVAKNGRQNYAAAGLFKGPDGVMHQMGQLQDER